MKIKTTEESPFPSIVSAKPTRLTLTKDAAVKLRDLLDEVCDEPRGH